MQSFKLGFRLATFAAAAVLLLLPEVSARQVRIAVVRDGPTAAGDLVPGIDAELGRLLGGVDAVTFVEAPQFNAGWDPARARTVLESALSDRTIDYVLVTGPLVFQEAARPDLKLTKPVVGAFIQRADLFCMPSDNASGTRKPNLSFVISPGGAASDIQTALEGIPFERAVIALDALYADHLEYLPALLRERGESLGVALTTWPVGSDVAAALAALPADAEWVFLAATPRLTADQRRALIAGLTERRLPTFSLLGHFDVELGALAASAPDLSQQLERRTALNIQQLIRGSSTGELPVVMQIDSRLLVNGRTASALGFALTQRVRATAQVLHPEALEPAGEPVSIQDVMEMVQAGNLQLAIPDADVERARQDVTRSRTPLLPQLNLDARYLNQGPETRRILAAENTLSAGLHLGQMIYDDRAVSGYRSQQRFYEGRQADREAVRLDALSDGAGAFLTYVLSELLYRIEAENLQLTEDNLQLARVRYQAGIAGSDEVYRWQAELAQGQSALLGAARLVETSRIGFNQVLGTDQSRRWQPREIDLDPDVFYFLDGGLNDIFRRSARWQKFYDFAVGFAAEQAPELQSLDLTLEAQNIQLSFRKRRYWLPEFSAELSYRYDFYRSSDLSRDIADDIYFLGVKATYPLLEGFGKPAEVKSLQAGIQSFEHRKQLVHDLIERRTRSAIERISSSFPAIKLSRIAAANSARNLDVVQEKYALGAVDITRLLEAQNQNFRAEQNAAAAVYQFMLDLVEFQRAMSWFADEKSPEERQEFLRRADEATAP